MTNCFSLIINLDRVMPTWATRILNTNIFHSPIMGLTHSIIQHFKFVQDIHTDERALRPEGHIIGSFNIKTQIRLYRKHQPQNSYSKSVFTYPEQFCLHTIEYNSIPQKSHIQSILTITSILNHFKLLRARWSRSVNTSNRCKPKLALSFIIISIRSLLICFPRSGPLSQIF